MGFAVSIFLKRILDLPMFQLQYLTPGACLLERAVLLFFLAENPGWKKRFFRNRCKRMACKEAQEQGKNKIKKPFLHFLKVKFITV
jgi:hypothetical protein